jgi:hypothetical protein
MGRSKSIASTLTLTLALAAGCGGGDGGGGGGGGGDGDGDGDGADGGGGSGCESGDCLDLEPPADGEGFQITSIGTVIHSGEDVEYCELAELPGTPDDTYYVNRFESVMTSGSHHLIVGAFDGEPDSGEVGDRVECFAGNGFGGNLIDVTGQQLPHHEDAFPDGVGRVYHGGQKIVWNYHYLNATEGDLPARAAVNFYTTDEANVQKIAESAGFLFLGIDVDAGDQASYTMSCDFSEDVMVHKLSRHTHKWGTDFPVYYKGGANDGDLIYTSPSYENPDHVFDEPILVEAGDGFRFTCNYDNDSDHHLGFGENATDEMCIMFATVYSPTGREVSDTQGCYAVMSE